MPPKGNSFPTLRTVSSGGTWSLRPFGIFPQLGLGRRFSFVPRAIPRVEEEPAEPSREVIHRFAAQACGRTRDSDAVGTPRRCQGGGI